MKKALLILAFLGLSACTNETDTIRTLQAHGFTNIRTTGYSWLECGKDDTFHTGFVATNPAGVQVAGTVCCGLWGKGCTVRF